MNDVVNKYINKLKSPKFLIIAGALGIALIYFSTLFSGGEKPKDDTVKTVLPTADEYKETIESDLRKMVTQITGSKKVTVVVTLENSVAYSYADIKEETESIKTEKEKQTSDSERKEGYVTVKTADGGEQALLITEQMPEIRGVAIVCEGGDNEIINEKIKNTVTAALNITSKRVYICGRN
jgi:stage III sporulation protein AG